MNKSINFGLNILRVILAFWIVIAHCANLRNKALMKIILGKNFHVPTFMMISFYFFYNNFFTRNIKKIKLRFIRLLIPYIIWPIIRFFLNNILSFIYGEEKNRKFIKIQFLINQIILGRKIHAVFWFQFNLIIITLLFTIISFLFNKENLLYFLILIFMVSYILQYSSLNYNYFIKYNINVSHSLGHITEMLPISISGIILGKLNIISKVEGFKSRIIFYSPIIVYFLYIKEIFIKPKGFQYEGINLNMGAIFLFIFFSIIPMNVNDQKIEYFLTFITNYTGGIYYLHTIVSRFLENRLIIIKNKTFIGCIFIYNFCYLICFIGLKIFNKNNLRYLFF